MGKTILLTCATDGIRFEAAKTLGALEGGSIESYDADLSTLSGARTLGDAVAGKHAKLNVLINYAGVCKTSGPMLMRPTLPNVKSLWRWLKRFW